MPPSISALTALALLSAQPGAVTARSLTPEETRAVAQCAAQAFSASVNGNGIATPRYSSQGGYVVAAPNGVTVTFRPLENGNVRIGGHYEGAHPLTPHDDRAYSKARLAEVRSLLEEGRLRLRACFQSIGAVRPAPR